MLELTSATRIAILASFVAVAITGLTFYLRQNTKDTMGGGISRPKALWLTYAIYVWFFMTPILALDTSLASPYRFILGAFSVSMWARGIAELLMLYVWKNWRPPYGIAHNIFSVTILAGGCFYFRDSLSAQTGALSMWAMGFVAFLVGAMLCETYYAIHFHDTVQGQTTGDDGVWFASAEDEKFKHINRITAICNTPIIGFIAAFILVWAV